MLRGDAELLSDAELVGLLLPGSGHPGGAALGLATLDGGLAGLLQACERDLRLPGLGRSRRAAVLAAVEL